MHKALPWRLRKAWTFLPHGAAILVFLSCGKAQRQEPAGDMAAVSTAAFASSLNEMARTSPPKDRSFYPDSSVQPPAILGSSVQLPDILARRTILTGTVGGRILLPPVIGSVIDIYGDTATGRCVRPNEVDIGAIPPGTLLKTDVRVEVQPLAEIHFNEIIEKQQSATAGYLAFSAAMSKDDRSEVLIQDVAGQQVANWDADKDTSKVRMAEARTLQDGACGRYVITGVVLTSVSYRLFAAKKAEGSYIGLFNFGRKDYYSRTKQRNDLQVGIQLQPIGFAVSPGLPPAPSPRPPETLKFIP